MSVVRRLVREQVAVAIEHDLCGGESIMKEVFENLPGVTDEEYQASLDECRQEMRALIGWLRGEVPLSDAPDPEAP